MPGFPTLFSRAPNVSNFQLRHIAYTERITAFSALIPIIFVRIDSDDWSQSTAAKHKKFAMLSQQVFSSLACAISVCSRYK